MKTLKGRNRREAQNEVLASWKALASSPVHWEIGEALRSTHQISSYLDPALAPPTSPFGGALRQFLWQA